MVEPVINTLSNDEGSYMHNSDVALLKMTKRNREKFKTVAAIDLKRSLDPTKIFYNVPWQPD